MTPTIRLETIADTEAIRHVNRLAFGRDDEAALVDALRAGGFARVSLVAEVNDVVVGHILFSGLAILTDSDAAPALSLAPMAVLPKFQRRGIGSILVRNGLEVCRNQGHRIVMVLGHSHFYPRFGFSARLAEPLSSPFGGGDSWMALELTSGALQGICGQVFYPSPFGVKVQVRPSNGPTGLRLLVVRGDFAVCKLPVGAPIPRWATAGDFFSIAGAVDELSVVCRQEFVPEGTTCERDWHCLRVAGSMPFTLVGVLASLTTAVAEAGVGVFAISTFDTDYLLVKAEQLQKAVAAMRAAGHVVDAVETMP